MRHLTAPTTSCAVVFPVFPTTQTQDLDGSCDLDSGPRRICLLLPLLSPNLNGKCGPASPFREGDGRGVSPACPTLVSDLFKANYERLKTPNCLLDADLARPPRGGARVPDKEDGRI
jgi:hypothetical protein